MKSNRCIVLSILALSLLAIACDKKDPPVEKPETVVAPPENETSAKAAQTPPAEPASIDFHGDRFAIAFEGKLVDEGKLEEKDGTRTSQKTWSSKRAVFSVNVNESMIEGPEHRVDEGMLDYVQKRFLESKKEVLDEAKIKLDLFPLEARYAHAVDKDGAKNHDMIIAADEYTTINFFVIEREPIPKEDVIAMAKSIRILSKAKPRTPAKPNTTSKEDVQDFLNSASERGEVSEEDMANVPRSEKPGEPSVGNSCNLITLKCYETAHSEIGQGYYSSEKSCTSVNGNYSKDPCPAENRIGFCLLNDQQLISFYKTEMATLEEHKSVCKTYRGKWLGIPKVRPWPKNEG